MRDVVYDATNPVDTSDVAKEYDRFVVDSLECAVKCANKVKGKVFRSSEEEGWVVNTRLGWVFDNEYAKQGYDHQPCNKCIVWTDSYDGFTSNTIHLMKDESLVEPTLAFFESCIDPAERDYKSVRICNISELEHRVVYKMFDDDGFDEWADAWYDRNKKVSFDTAFVGWRETK